MIGRELHYCFMFGTSPYVEAGQLFPLTFILQDNRVSSPFLLLQHGPPTLWITSLLQNIILEKS